MRRGTAALSSFAPLAALTALTALVAFALPSARATAQEKEKPQGAVRVVGRVVSVLCEGVPAAEVWACDASGARVARTVADGDGFFQLARLPDVPLRVWARAVGKVESTVEVTGAGAVRAATLMLEDGDPLHGVVTFADKSPAAGAAVIVTVATGMSKPDWSAETTTDAKGEWTLPCAPLRAMRMRAFVAGKPSAEEEIAAGRDGVVRTVIPAGEAMARRVVVKGAPAGRAVRVWLEVGNSQTTRNEQAVPLAAVEALADADGVATLWDLPVSGDVRVALAGHRSMPVCIPCRPGVARELEFTLSPLPADLVAPRTRVTGKLLDEVGQPIAGVRVVGQLEGTKGEPAATADDGSFALDVPVRAGVLCQIGLLSSDWCLGAGKKTALARDGVRWLTISADPATPLRLDAQRAGAVRGTLLGPNGTPFGAASVVIASKLGAVETATNAAGVVDVAGLPPGSYELTASQLDLVGTGTVEIVARGVAEPVALKFPVVGELRGVATDGSGKPLASIPFSVELGKQMQRLRRMPAGVLAQMRGQKLRLTDRRGNFRLPYVAEGEWVVMVQSPNPQPRAPNAAVLTPVTVEAGKVATVEVRVGQ